MKYSKNNPHRRKFIDTFPTSTLEEHDIVVRSKYNFSFFDDSQNAAVSFSDLDQASLAGLFEKLKNFSRNDLNYWRTQRCGGGGLKILADYGDFPENSGFLRPKHVPMGVNWARFRLENMTRLVGFTIPPETNKKIKGLYGSDFDSNTFYVVFVDLEHQFYITEQK
ncbi:hypothetical protein [Pseudomonas taiwanensis]|uniref:hypothetical protein n=1 Tax=Pseudomonas taiwanensis TaxID=470150 RepID=UPI0012DC5C2B|nr:hypothetical protein [Pseudomonas taiwanensis]